VTEEPVVTEEHVRKFLRAVLELGKGKYKGLAGNTDIAKRMDLDPSGLDPKNQVTKDSRLYRRTAEYCADEGYITSDYGRYELVAITPKGEQYLRSIE
jgi:hypothetical protein